MASTVAEPLNPPQAPPPAPQGSQVVDLGASPLRAATVDIRGPTRLADLLARKPAPAPVPAWPAPAVPAPRGASPLGATSLQDLLARVRETQQKAQAAVASVRPAAPPPAPPAPPAPPLRIRNVTVDRRAEFEAAAAAAQDPSAEVAALAAGAAAAADRRREILDQFDRTFAEVQSMLEQRLGMVDPGPAGEAALARAASADEGTAAELERLAGDLERVVNDLARMMVLCEELGGRLAAITARHAGPEAGGGGA